MRPTRPSRPLALLAAGAAVAVLAALPAGSAAARRPAGQSGRPPGRAGRAPRDAGRPTLSAASDASLEAGYEFLDQMMDRYATGAQPRLVQSYSGGVLEEEGFTESVTYDDALIIDALVARGTPEDIERAEVIGNALLYVQANDPDHDGRVRAGYAPTPLLSPADVDATEPTSDVGNMAWVGQALVQLYTATGQDSYLQGASAIGEWIQANAYDTRGSGGYTGGQEPRGTKIEWKSTEHNIDLYSFFGLLAGATHDSVWSTRAAWARHFVESMWSASKGMFWVGTGENGVTLNKSVRPEDVNSWSYLALQDPAFQTSLDWDVRNLSVSRNGFSGVSFCERAKKGVWFEGTAHLADALELRAGQGDGARAQEYLGDIAHAQTSGLNSDGLGIIAASINGLSDCEGERYFASLHTGATAWYLLALQAADPFFILR